MNPAVAPIGAVVRYGIDEAPLGRGFAHRRRAALGRSRRRRHRPGPATWCLAPAPPLMGGMRGLPARHPHRISDAAPSPDGRRRAVADRRHRRRGVDRPPSTLALWSGARVFVTSRDPREDRRAAVAARRRSTAFDSERGVGGQGRHRHRKRRSGHLGAIGAHARAEEGGSSCVAEPPGPEVDGQFAGSSSSSRSRSSARPWAARRIRHCDETRLARLTRRRRRHLPDFRLPEGAGRLEAGEQLGKLVLTH